jgi:hypothetical protein
MPTAIMELLVFYPETTEPKRRHFDGPVLVGVQQAIGENAEVIPGFSTIPCDGVIPAVHRLLRPRREAERPAYQHLGHDTLAYVSPACRLRAWLAP